MNAPFEAPLRAASLHDHAGDRLRAMILDGHLNPGQWIDEKALASSWQISRTPLREALKVLAAEGLVELVPHRGCRVIELSDQDADALFPVMALLEGQCAREAVAHLTASHLTDLRALHDKLETHAAAQDRDGYYRVNHEFHSLVQRLAGNRWLDRVTTDLRQFMRMMRGRQLALPGRMKQSLQEHRALLAAFESRDADRAEHTMRHHLLMQLEAFKTLRKRQASQEKR